MKFKDLVFEIEKLNSTNAKRSQAVARAPYNRLVAYFGELELSNLGERSWNNYVVHSKRQNPGRRLIHDRKYMKAALLLAFREGLITRDIKLKIPDKAREIGREVTAAELKALYSCAAPNLHFQIDIAVRMGLRRGEMLGLRWERFNWTANLIMLTEEDTKTRRGRQVPIPAILLPEFTKRRRRKRTPFVFPSKFDPQKPQTGNRYHWNKCRSLAKVNVRWHDLRHTAASIMGRVGIPEGVACRILGMSAKVFRRIYRHLNEDELAAAANAMSDYDLAK